MCWPRGWRFEMPTMPDLPPCTDQNLQLTLRLDVRLSRAGTESGWSGEISAQGHDGRLCFPSLPALIAWIARLEPPPPPRGIR